MALFTYRLLLLLLLPVILVIVLLRSISQRAYRQRLGERLGFYPNNFKQGGIVIHGASVGEVLSLKPFIESCLNQFPHLPITVTTFTPTGSEQVQKLFGNRVQHCYLPLDIYPCTALFLGKLKPKALVIMETELWPNLTAQAAKQQVKLLLINGRISDKSFTSYQKFSPLITPCLAAFDKVLAQSEDNQARLIQLGASPETCLTIGNLKYDIQTSRSIEEKYQLLKPLVNVAEDKRPTWLLASSHDGDEQLALAAFEQVRQHVKNALLIIVPRHPERFSKVAELLTERGVSFIKRSSEQTITADTHVWLMDSLGELMAGYQLADIVTIGGTFSTIGGHNPLEPALYQKPVIVGNDMANFKEVHSQLIEANAINTLAFPVDNKTLAHEVIQLLTNHQRSTELGSNAYQVVMANQGSSKRAVTELATLLVN